MSTSKIKTMQNKNKTFLGKLTICFDPFAAIQLMDLSAYDSGRGVQEVCYTKMSMLRSTPVIFQKQIKQTSLGGLEAQLHISGSLLTEGCRFGVAAACLSELVADSNTSIYPDFVTCKT